MRSCLVIWVFIISSIGVYTEGRWMQDTFSSHLRDSSTDTGGNLDEVDDYSLIVNRGNDVLTSTRAQATMPTTKTPKGRSTSSSKISTRSTIKTSITPKTTNPIKSIRSMAMSTAATEGAFGVHLERSKTGLIKPLHFDGALANRLSRYNFSTNSIVVSTPQFLYSEICAGVHGKATGLLRTRGFAYPPLYFHWRSRAQNGVDSGCRGGVLQVLSMDTISIGQEGDGVYSSSDQKETSWSMFSVTDTMKYDSQLLCVFGYKSWSANGTLSFLKPEANPVSTVPLYNAATTAYTCDSDASAYFFSMSVGVPAEKTATVQLVISGMNYTFEMTRQNTQTTGITTLARTVLVPCRGDARMLLAGGEVVTGLGLISFTAFPYKLKTGTSVSWAGYRTSDVTINGTITYDLWLVQEGITFQAGNSIVQIPVSGHYYVYISAGLCPEKQLSLSVMKNGEVLFGLTRTSTNHNGLDTAGHGMVVLLSKDDQLRVNAIDARKAASCSSSGLYTSYIGILLYQD